MLFKLLGWRGRMDLDEERYSTWGWGPHALTSHGHGHGHGGRRHPMAAMVPPPPPSTTALTLSQHVQLQQIMKLLGPLKRNVYLVLVLNKQEKESKNEYS